jgi:CHAD domain-containing protein
VSEVDAGRPIEVELKYHMTDTSAGDRLLGTDELAGLPAVAPPETIVHEDRYVDTDDGALTAAGYAGRFRTSAGETLIALKGLRREDEGGVAHRREELEGPADANTAVSAWPASTAREAVLAIAGDSPLRELVQVRQVRRRRAYGAAGAMVELSVDDVEVVMGDRTIERFAELEVELREGDEAVLEPFAELLSEIEELVPSDASKLERAMEAVHREGAAHAAGSASSTGEGWPAGSTKLTGQAATARPADGTAPQLANASPGQPDDGTESADAAAAGMSSAAPTAPTAPTAPAAPAPSRLVVAKSPGVLADDHLAEAARKVIRFHLARMIAREAGMREGKDPEELHAMRVATRRQRAAWRVFGDAFDGRYTDRYTRRLKLVARDLGAVRDLDVLIEAGESYQSGLSTADRTAFEPLLRSWRTQRDTAREVLVRELDSARYRRWLDAYVAFAQVDGLGARAVGPVEPHRVRDTMASRIWAAYEVVRAYEPVMRWADVTTLHDLRIAAKWLRYTLEFVREALGREAGSVIEKIVALQDHLGWLHDADVAAHLARTYLVEHAGQLSEAESAAIGRYLVDRERELARLRRTAGPAWRGVSSPAFRRALGRVVAGL